MERMLPQMWVQDNMALTIRKSYGSLQNKNIQTAKKHELKCQQLEG
jgi:hypothetical protein